MLTICRDKRFYCKPTLVLSGDIAVKSLHRALSSVRPGALEDAVLAVVMLHVGAEVRICAVALVTIP